ncbi:ABC transporter permease [Flavobacterium sp. GT3R68]|uniref:ABC transporter permease n=1 Tax=Flavobacterium sp. GT3R68 TaxID=2594437 RepID=UPI000F88D767|nr:FtsX-like permease family protein [Flavobacterium sp. GT3R68]RTY95743.1 ABC transporter permease [Flavobacterium sp. GSN2]TRW93514.1 ABC transporter permease [Flavobacterium sp. GT3R68]
MNFSLYIAKRYLRSASKNNAINIINIIASLGIIVGSMVLFVALSIFSGLIDFSLSFSNDFDPDLKISSTLGKSFTVSPRQQTDIKNIDGVVASSKIVEERVLFMFAGKEQVTFIKGVDKHYREVNDLKEVIYQGQWFADSTAQVVVGYGITQKLSLGLMDFNNAFEVFVPKSGRGTIDSPEQAFTKSELYPVGIYAISEELDSKYVFADLTLTQELVGWKANQVSGIELKLKPGADEEKIKEQLQKIYNNKITVKNRKQLNDSLYKMLNTENTILYLICTLVIVLTLFTLAGAIIMMIIDKKSNLKTMYSLGTEVKDLRKIFLFQGTLLSIIGGLLGLVLGIIFVIVQQQFSLIMITPSLAYPVVFSVKNVLIVLATIVPLGFIASLIASSRVTKGLLES